jgi:hypothetical protein
MDGTASMTERAHVGDPSSEEQKLPWNTNSRFAWSLDVSEPGDSHLPAGQGVQVVI